MGDDGLVLIYDGDCGFCRRVAGWVRHWGGDRLLYLRSQVAVQRYPSIGERETSTSVLLFGGDGSLFRGMEVLYRVGALGGTPFFLNLYRSSRLFAWLSDRGYGWVEKIRPFLSRMLDFLLGPPPEDL
jgi:predicted DCC family thiol-disulfide oxidoreductase YuxK